MLQAGRTIRVAVTGSGGFVGRWLMQHLSNAPNHAFEAIPFFQNNPDTRDGDISERASVEQRVKVLRPDIIVHLASIAAPAEAARDPRRCFEVNVTGTLNLAQAVLKHAPDTGLIFVGSSEAYGQSFNLSDAPLDEEAAFKPLSMYGTSKAAADLIVAQFARDGLKAVRLRPFNHTGPGQSPDYVVSAFARQIAQIEQGLQEPMLRVGNLDAERDFLDVRDVVRAYALTASKCDSIPRGAPINIASGSPRRIKDILDALLAMSDAKIDVSVDPDRFRANEIPRASGDPGRALEYLEWKPLIGLETTLRDALEYWRQKPH